MVLYFQRTLDTIRDRYRQILRMETIKFDPMVNKYFEGEYTTNGTDNSETRKTLLSIKDYRKSDTINETRHEQTDDDYAVTNDVTTVSGSTEDNGTYENSGHDAKTGNNQISGRSNSSHSNSTIDNTTNHSQDNTTTHGSSGEINHKAVKQAPMNASGVTTNATAGVTGESVISGALGNLDFGYATAYDANDKTGKTFNSNAETIDSTSQTNGSDTGSSSETSTNTHVINEGTDRSDSGEDHKEGTYDESTQREYGDSRDIVTEGSTEKQGSMSGRDVLDNLEGTTKDGSVYTIKHDRYTGRDGVLPQDALKSAMNYLQNYSTAFEWLCNKLEINFIGIYDI